MKYAPPFGDTNPEAHYINASPAQGIAGSPVPAEAIEPPMREIVEVITAAGLEPSEADLTQLRQAINLLIAANVAPLATPIQNGLVPLGGTPGQIYGVSADGQSYGFRALPPAYQIGEFRSWFEQQPPPGWAVRNGAVLTEADVQYPELWEYLQATVNEWKCKTLAEWTALSTAAGGVGGVPFFVLDAAAKTIKLPDTRGDYERAAGGGTMANVGDWQGDAIRNITASMPFHGYVVYSSSGGGAFYGSSSNTNKQATGNTATGYYYLNFDASRQVPTAAENRTRAFGLLPCVYIGGV